MTSPQAALSNIIRHISPQKLQPFSNIRQVLSPKSPIKNKLSVENIYNSPASSPKNLNFDTPNRRNIVNKGMIDKCKKVLGKGAFGTVYRGDCKGNTVAVKIIKRNADNDFLIDHEKQAALLRHSNIVKVLSIDEGPAATLITMELCGKSLQSMLEERILIKNERVSIWLEIVEALRYCHRKGIIHADVKPRNVLIGSDNKPKLADFGSAVLVSEDFSSNKFHGTPGYAAPEVICGEKPTPSSDVYSLGVTAWQMLSRKYPFENLHKHSILYLTGKGMVPSDDDLDDELQGDYKRLYRMSWSKDANERPSTLVIIKELLMLKDHC